MATGQVLFQRFFYTKSFVKHSMEVRGSSCGSCPQRYIERSRGQLVLPGGSEERGSAPFLATALPLSVASPSGPFFGGCLLFAPNVPS